MKITDLKVREGGKHYYSKQYLYDWILDDNVLFKAGNMVFNLNVNYNNNLFSSLESYVYKESESNEPFHSGICHKCFPNENLEGDWDRWTSQYYKFSNERFKENQGSYNKNILILDEDYNLNQFILHPCNFCRFKGRLNCIFIFDIAFAKKGAYFLAIEVVDTSPTKQNKITFCKNNNITLIEVQSSDILKQSSRKNKILKCKILNEATINYNLEYRGYMMK